MSIKKLIKIAQRYSAIILGEPQDREQLVSKLRRHESRGLLTRDALVMIEGTLGITEMQVRDIMIPRIQMVSIKYNASYADILATSIASGHSRFPVIGNDNNEVVGILLAKDLLQYSSTEEEPQNFNIKDIMRGVFYVPESKRLNILLLEFRTNHNHMAIVVDEYSGVAGLVTLEDIMEEIVGDIEDEHDRENDPYIKELSGNRYIVRALTTINEFNNFFSVKFSDAEYETIGGTVLHAFGHVPKRNDSIEIEGFSIKILRADNRKIQLMRINKLTQDPPVSTSDTV